MVVGGSTNAYSEKLSLAGAYGGGTIGSNGVIYEEGFGGQGGCQTYGGIATTSGLSSTSGKFGKRWRW